MFELPCGEYDLLSVDNQIISYEDYDVGFGILRQEATLDMRDISCILGERKCMKDFVGDNIRCWNYEFFFHVYITYLNNKPKNEDIHYNVVIKKVLEWYMCGPMKNEIDKLFKGNDILRVCVKRHFSCEEKHTFSISIISLLNHEGDWGELKNMLLNPDPNDICVVDSECNIKIRGEYPIDICDLNGNYLF